VRGGERGPARAGSRDWRTAHPRPSRCSRSSSPAAAQRWEPPASVTAARAPRAGAVVGLGSTAGMRWTGVPVPCRDVHLAIGPAGGGLAAARLAQACVPPLQRLSPRKTPRKRPPQASNRQGLTFSFSSHTAVQAPGSWAVISSSCDGRAWFGAASAQCRTPRRRAGQWGAGRASDPPSIRALARKRHPRRACPGLGSAHAVCHCQSSGLGRAAQPKRAGPGRPHWPSRAEQRAAELCQDGELFAALAGGLSRKTSL